jgi:hypothetical protein
MRTKETKFTRAISNLCLEIIFWKDPTGSTINKPEVVPDDQSQSRAQGKCHNSNWFLCEIGVNASDDCVKNKEEDKETVAKFHQ